MRILVFANTNGNADLVYEVFKQQKPDAVFHLGNGIKDLRLLRFDVPLYVTKGCFDHFVCAPKITKIMAEKTLILCTYGNKFKTNRDLKMLTQKAKKEHANIVLFGYGQKTYTKRDGIIFVNPGQILKNSVSCILLDINENNIEIEDINFVKMT